MKKRVVVAMSGGVDSSVCAALAKNEGYDVIGITLQLYNYSGGITSPKSCCASRDVCDARNVAEKLDIPYYVINCEDAFKEDVIDDFVNQYTSGYTPIPCIKCNQTVKFRDLLKIAKDLNADSLITGHYVQKKTGNFGNELHTGADKTKDQSYFLFKTTLEQLNFLEFPLGGFEKSYTRTLAEKFDLPVSNKPDSQNICFVPNGDYASVIEKFRPESIRDGDIIDIASGKTIGKHNGIIGYTVGQRRRLGIAAENPLYVVKIDAQNNTVCVGDETFLYHKQFEIDDASFLLNANEKIPKKINVRVRSSCTEIPCTLDGNTITLDEKSKLISPGQAAVFYDGTRVIGGGFIRKILD